MRHGYESTFLLNRPDAEWMIPSEDRIDFTPQAHELFAHPIRRYFTPKEQRVINYAVFWHAERQVPAPQSNAPEHKHLSYKICYMLRDLDKKDILLDEPRDYFEPEGVLEQLKILYLNPDQRTSLDNDPLAAQAATVVISELLKSNQVPKVTGLPADLSARIAEVMNAGVSESAWATFLGKGAIHIQEIKHSWVNMMLLQLAMIFDIQTPGILEEIYSEQDRYLNPRLNIIGIKTDQAKTQVARDVIVNYIVGKRK